MDEAMTYEEFQEKVGGIILTAKGNCPVTPVVQIRSPMRFGELKKALTPITNAMLTNALKELETDGLVHREPYSEIPPRVEYTLTPKGRDLLPVFYAICQWGMKYIP